jgi:hypothetical protein
MDDVRGLVLLKYGQGLALAAKKRDARRYIFSFAMASRWISLFKSYRDRKSFSYVKKTVYFPQIWRPEIWQISRMASKHDDSAVKTC